MAVSPPHGRFLRNTRGGVAMQAALVFGAVGMAMAVFGPPVLESATLKVAQLRQQELDTTTTGSVAQGGRYTIRRSVLSSSPQVMCGTRTAPHCLPGSR